LKEQKGVEDIAGGRMVTLVLPAAWWANSSVPCWRIWACAGLDCA